MHLCKDNKIFLHREPDYIKFRLGPSSEFVSKYTGKDAETDFYVKLWRIFNPSFEFWRVI